MQNTASIGWIIKCDCYQLAVCDCVCYFSVVCGVQACWMLQQFSEVPFKNISNLQRLVDLLAQSLCEDKELPVRVEASMAIQHILSDQEKGVL